MPVYGLDADGEIEGEFIEAGTPLTLHQAARAVGVRLRRSREIFATDLFQREYNKAIRAHRNAEKPRNLQVAKDIRDDRGDGSAAFATARLKAIQTIEGRDGGTSVNVQVNQINGGQHVSPGYVIRLKEPAQGAPRAGPMTIEGKAIDAELLGVMPNETDARFGTGSADI